MMGQAIFGFLSAITFVALLFGCQSMQQQTSLRLQQTKLAISSSPVVGGGVNDFGLDHAEKSDLPTFCALSLEESPVKTMVMAKMKEARFNVIDFFKGENGEMANTQEAFKKACEKQIQCDIVMLIGETPTGKEHYFKGGKGLISHYQLEEKNCQSGCSQLLSSTKEVFLLDVKNGSNKKDDLQDHFSFVFPSAFRIYQLAYEPSNERDFEQKYREFFRRVGDYSFYLKTLSSSQNRLVSASFGKYLQRQFPGAHALRREKVPMACENWDLVSTLEIEKIEKAVRSPVAMNFEEIEKLHWAWRQGKISTENLVAILQEKILASSGGGSLPESPKRQEDLAKAICAFPKKEIGLKAVSNSRSWEDLNVLQAMRCLGNAASDNLDDIGRVALDENQPDYKRQQALQYFIESTNGEQCS